MLKVENEQNLLLYDRNKQLGAKNEGKWLFGGEYEQQYSGTSTKMYAVGRKYAITIENEF